MSERNSEDDDAVGYGKPPRHTRWKPGQSGNPRGRKRGSRGLKTDLHAELESKMTIQINGQKVTASKQELMLKTLCARAASGDLRATGRLIDLVMTVFGPEDRGTGPARLSPADQAILDDYLAERSGSAAVVLKGPEENDHDPD